MAEKNLRGNQIEFINLIIDHLTERGAMDPRRLYESPFTDFDDQGVSGVFPQADVQQIVQVNDVRERAAASAKKSIFWVSVSFQSSTLLPKSKSCMCAPSLSRTTWKYSSKSWA
jgi:hypothetical protein